MKNNKYSLDNIRSYAKKLKKERGITHVQALEVIAKEHGYANWIHCLRSLSQQSVEAIPHNEKVQIEFIDWLKRHKNRDSPLGDLSKDMLRDDKCPSYNSLEEYQSYLYTLHLRRGASSALEAAWKSYKRYIRQLTLPPKKLKAVEAVNQLNRPPKIVYVKNVIPLPFSKRTAEKFSPGDLAWISWNGRKALPVTILDVDDRHYTFRMERPLKKAGDEHYLFLDEVRSTPELACINYVTN